MCTEQNCVHHQSRANQIIKWNISTNQLNGIHYSKWAICLLINISFVIICHGKREISIFMGKIISYQFICTRFCSQITIKYTTNVLNELPRLSTELTWRSLLTTTIYGSDMPQHRGYKSICRKMFVPLYFITFFLPYRVYKLLQGSIMISERNMNYGKHSQELSLSINNDRNIFEHFGSSWSTNADDEKCKTFKQHKSPAMLIILHVPTWQKTALLWFALNISTLAV